ncbi:OLC1v1005471C1 [Oldenlandia corymbosa var. corymbosa]|uniref:OLC1v1005471C1 n=1 Tax=Oldenlandia corymbosa var. corymbosa TaxID=529605 RepID=A0AAV1DGP1_OLDCO|nr:OLC1v1005471C1 [Oldenlandia corymbosa var. corymbosa]
MAETEEAVRRRTAVADYRKKLLTHKELESRVRGLRENLRATKKEYAKTEDDLKSLQSVGQIIGEVLRPLDNERLIVKASSGPRYVVGCRNKVDKEKLTAGTRVVLDMTTLTIMRALPREVDPVVYNMLHEDPGNVSYSAVGGLSDQIRELRESIELPLMNPELFLRVGIKPPKGVLLYGPPGTGKTLLARAIASNIDANFLKVVSSAIIDKYIGESARLIRRCLDMLVITNLALYLWMRLMLLVGVVLARGLVLIGKFKEHLWNCLTSWMVLTSLERFSQNLQLCASQIF